MKRKFVLTPAALLVAVSAHPLIAQEACNPEKSAALRQAFSEKINELKCDRIQASIKGISVGIDQAAHVVENACYVEGGKRDRIQVNATIRCKTSDAALIPASFSDNLDARINIDNCKIVDSDVNAAGEIGKVLVETVEFFKGFKQPLQDVVTKVCQVK